MGIERILMPEKYSSMDVLLLEEIDFDPAYEAHLLLHRVKLLASLPGFFCLQKKKKRKTL